MGKSLRIMGIYAHPADVATEAAGTMAIHADRGDELTAVVLSDGIRMHPHFLTVGEGAGSDEPVSHAAYAEFKRDEVRRAAAIIGIANTEFMGWDQNFFNATDERITTLAHVIVRYRPRCDPDPLPGRAVPDRLERVRRHLRHPGRCTRPPRSSRRSTASSRITRRRLFFFLMDQSMDTRSNIDTPGIVADFFVDTTACHRPQGPGIRPVRQPGLRGPLRTQGRRGARRAARHARRVVVCRALPALAQRQL